MKKDLAEVKAYAEAMAESNHARDMYVDKEQDKFFCRLSRQRVTFGFRRNPDAARNGRSGGRKRVRPIAIDYCTVAGTAGAECKGD